MSNLIDYLYGKTREFAGSIQVNLNALIKGKLQVDDTTEATTTTDGAGYIKGGLSVAKKGVFGDTVTVGAYTLPATDGTNEQVLKTNGSGVLTWQDESGGGGDSTLWEADGASHIKPKNSKLVKVENIDGAGGGSVDPEVNALGNIDGATDIDLSDGLYVTGTLTDDITISFASAGRPASDYVRNFTLRFSGNEDITYPDGTKFSGSVEPVIVGTEYLIEGMIDSSGNVTIYGVIDNIGAVA